MPWVKEICEDAICAIFCGGVKGLFGVSMFSSQEVEEIGNLQSLAESIAAKSPKFVTNPRICDGIQKGDMGSLKEFAANAQPEVVAVGVVSAAKLVCGKAAKTRFRDVLMGACLNLVGCN